MSFVLTTRDAMAGAATVGANLTLIVQLLPARTVFPQLFENVNWFAFNPDSTTLLIASDVVPTFVSVTSREVLVVPTV